MALRNSTCFSGTDKRETGVAILWPPATCLHTRKWYVVMLSETSGRLFPITRHYYKYCVGLINGLKFIANIMNSTGQVRRVGGNLHGGLFMVACFYYESHFASFSLSSSVLCFSSLFLLSVLSVGRCPLFRGFHFALQIAVSIRVVLCVSSWITILFP